MARTVPVSDLILKLFRNNLLQVLESLFWCISLSERTLVIIPKIYAIYIVTVYCLRHFVELQREGQPFSFAVDSPVAVLYYCCRIASYEPDA